MHEDFTREEKVEGSSDRSFGLVMAAFFAIVALLPLRHAPLSSIRWWALAVAAAFPVLALLWTTPLRPLNRLWTKLGLLLSKIVSPIVLMVLFYVTVTPIGCSCARPARTRCACAEPGRKSYWIARPAGTGAGIHEKPILRRACCRFCGILDVSARPQEVLADPDPHHDGDLRRADRADEGSAIAPFIYTLF